MIPAESNFTNNKNIPLVRSNFPSYTQLKTVDGLDMQKAANKLLDLLLIN